MRIAFICLPLTGHLVPMCALAREVQKRGHQVTIWGVVDSKAFVEQAGLRFVSFCEEEYPIGSVHKLWNPIKKLRGLEAIRYWAEHIHPSFLERSLQALPGALTSESIEGVVIDTAYAFIELAAMSANIPFVQTWLVLNFDASGATPPNLFDWPYETTPEARARNLEGVAQVAEAFFAPALPVAAAYLETAGLAVNLADPTAMISKVAVISQTPKSFDYPDIPWFPQFSYAGPFSDPKSRPATTFDWAKLNGRPLIYASLGTISNGLTEIHKAILAAVARLPEYQVVFAVGDGVVTEEIAPIPENVVIVSSAPQVELLSHSVLCITHAGLNTVLETLAAGIPMVAIPVAYDQPGVAARIAYHGVGEFVPYEKLSADAIFDSIRSVLGNPIYRAKAKRSQSALAQNDGLGKAASLIIEGFRPDGGF